MKAMNEQTSAAVEEVRLTNCEFLTVQQVAKILKVDPAMMAGPLISTLVDAVALIIYFSIATMLLL